MSQIIDWCGSSSVLCLIDVVPSSVPLPLTLCVWALPRVALQEAVTTSGLTIIRRLCEEGAKEGEQVEGPLEAGRLYSYEVVISSALPTATVLDVLITIPKVNLKPQALEETRRPCQHRT